MKFTLKFFISFLLIFVISGLSLTCFAQSEGSPSASYNYTYWGEVTRAPEAYNFERTVNLGLVDKDFSYPTDFILADDFMVIADSGANRVVAVNFDGNIKWILKDFINGEKNDAFNAPNSVEYHENELYVADTGNGRILKFDENLLLMKEFKAPKINIEGKISEYKPLQVAVDSSKRMYVIAKNINQGLILLNQNGDFEGFMGAPKVKVSLVQLMWRLFSTKEQLSRLAKFVPTEYNSLDMDDSGFIYCTSNSYNQGDIYTAIATRDKSDRFAMIKRLNPAGLDVLRRTGSFTPAGDIRTPSSSFPGAPVLSSGVRKEKNAILGQSSFVDAKALDGGIYFCLDNARNRVFCYDNYGNLLFVTGGMGERNESLSNPVAIEYKDSKLYILNSASATVQIYSPTRYGSLLLEAAALYKNGHYELSEQKWTEILAMNSNLEQAHTMIGKIALRNNNFKEAMTGFYNGNNREEYSKAYRLYRASVIEDNFLLVILFAVLLIALLLIIPKGIKRLAKSSGVFGSIFKNISNVFYVIFHPFDGFYMLKHEKKGNLTTAFIILGLAVLSSVLQKTQTAFIFNNSNPKYVNVPFTAASVLLTFFIFAASNWCFTTLMDGKGTFRDILVFTGYAQAPVVLLNIPLVIISHMLTLDEGMLFTAILAITNIWYVFLIFFGMMVTHDYSLKKNIITAVLTIFGIVVIVFVGLLFINVIERMSSFAGLLFEELSYR